MLPPLLFKWDNKLAKECQAVRPFAPHPAATAPTNAHPRDLDDDAHASILHQISLGAKIWERPVTDAILAWTIRDHQKYSNPEPLTAVPARCRL